MAVKSISQLDEYQSYNGLKGDELMMISKFDELYNHYVSKKYRLSSLVQDTYNKIIVSIEAYYNTLSNYVQTVDIVNTIERTQDSDKKVVSQALLDSLSSTIENHISSTKLDLSGIVIEKFNLANSTALQLNTTTNSTINGLIKDKENIIDDIRFLSTSIDSISSTANNNQAELKSKIAQISASLSSHLSEANTKFNAIKNIETSLNAITKKENDTASKLKDTNTTVDSLKTSLDSIGNKLVTTNTEVANLKTSLDSIGNKLVTTNATVANLKTSLDSTADKLEATNTAMQVALQKNLGVTIKAIQEQIDSLTSDVKSIKHKLDIIK